MFACRSWHRYLRSHAPTTPSNAIVGQFPSEDKRGPASNGVAFTSLQINQPTRMILLPLALLLASATAQQCTLCADGSTGTLSNSFGGSSVTCGSIGGVIGSTAANSSDCKEVQVQAFQFCDCPTYPEDYFCSLCPDGDFNLTEMDFRRQVPIFPADDEDEGFRTCRDILFEPIADGACEAVTSAAGFCGCPTAPPRTCFLCENATAVTKPTARVPPLFRQTCESLDTLTQFAVSNETCANTTTNFPVNVPQFCGCADAMEEPLPALNCSLCANFTEQNLDKVVNVELGVTCQTLIDTAPFVTDADYCDSLVADFQVECCAGAPTQAPTAPPTLAPIMPVAAPTMAPTNETIDRSSASVSSSCRLGVLATLLFVATALF